MASLSSAAGEEAPTRRVCQLRQIDNPEPRASLRPRHAKGDRIANTEQLKALQVFFATEEPPEAPLLWKRLSTQSNAETRRSKRSLDIFRAGSRQLRQLLRSRSVSPRAALSGDSLTNISKPHERHRHIFQDPETLETLSSPSTYRVNCAVRGYSEKREAESSMSKATEKKMMNEKAAAGKQGLMDLSHGTSYMIDGILKDYPHLVASQTSPHLHPRQYPVGPRADQRVPSHFSRSGKGKEARGELGEKSLTSHHRRSDDRSKRSKDDSAKPVGSISASKYSIDDSLQANQSKTRDTSMTEAFGTSTTSEEGTKPRNSLPAITKPSGAFSQGLLADNVSKDVPSTKSRYSLPKSATAPPQRLSAESTFSERQTRTAGHSSNASTNSVETAESMLEVLSNAQNADYIKARVMGCPSPAPTIPLPPLPECLETTPITSIFSLKSADVPALSQTPLQWKVHPTSPLKNWPSTAQSIDGGLHNLPESINRLSYVKPTSNSDFKDELNKDATTEDGEALNAKAAPEVENAYRWRARKTRALKRRDMERDRMKEEEKAASDISNGLAPGSDDPEDAIITLPPVEVRQPETTQEPQESTNTPRDQLNEYNMPASTEKRGAVHHVSYVPSLLSSSKLEPFVFPLPPDHSPTTSDGRASISRNHNSQQHLPRKASAHFSHPQFAYLPSSSHRSSSTSTSPVSRKFQHESISSHSLHHRKRLSPRPATPIDPSYKLDFTSSGKLGIEPSSPVAAAAVVNKPYVLEGSALAELEARLESRLEVFERRTMLLEAALVAVINADSERRLRGGEDGDSGSNLREGISGSSGVGYKTGTADDSVCASDRSQGLLTGFLERSRDR